MREFSRDSDRSPGVRPAGLLPRGFTLVELLVVLAILTMLIAILLPSMAGAREAARRAVCLSNQRQIALGSLSYASDHFGTLPVFRSWTTYVVPDTSRAFLLNVVGSSPGVFYCPSDPRNSASNPDTGWNAASIHSNNKPYQARYISYSPIGIWEQSATSIFGLGREYTALPLNKHPTLTDQGNRPHTLAQAGHAADLAMVTDSQNSWDASLGFSFTYPGDKLWQESSIYYNTWAYPHRDAANAWAGGNTVMFDGSGRWANFSQTIRLDQPYPYGAKWFMHYHRGVYEGAMFW